MASPSVRVNTLVQETDKINIDPISKIFIISEAIFGFFRLPLIRNGKLFYYLLAVTYVVFLNGAIFFLTLLHVYKTRSFSVMIIFNILRYIFCSLFGFICVKKLQLYYTTLNKFDMEVGCRPKVSRQSLQNLAQTAVTVVLLFIVYILPMQLGVSNRTILHFLVLKIAFTLEMNFYGHLLNILVPRLKLINYYIESSLSNVTSESSSLMDEFVSFKRNASSAATQYGMDRLMDLYYVVVEAYDYLIDAIKWQLLLSIITSFVAIVGFLFIFSLNFIQNRQDIKHNLLWELSLPILMLAPLFSPCTFADTVHHEVKRLRELLASRLYENKLDKCGRSVARALLAFTETRDLSFRLLRMLNIDISLPFKFIGLLITYLIILLQFEKVINPGDGYESNEIE